MRSYSPLTCQRLEERDVPSTTPLDLTTRNSSGMINDAAFLQFDARPTGTGHINSFLRIQGASSKGQVQQGFNTDARPLQFNENKSPQFTRSLKLGELPQINLGGRMYREILLDINQKSSQPFLSLDQLRIFHSNISNLSNYNTSAGTLSGLAPVYDLDADGDNWVKLDYRLNTGSGSGDMMLFVPEAVFGGAGDNEYVYLYSAFGVHFAGNAGFQEWAPAKNSVGTGSISGMKFNDLDGSGIRDYYDENLDGVSDTLEPALADWFIYLDANQNGSLDLDETYTITDSIGQYSFASLGAGLGALSTYYVREVQQEGWEQITANPDRIVLEVGQSITGIDFGNRQISPPPPPNT